MPRAEGTDHNICCLIPAHNEEKTVRAVVEGCRRHVEHVAVIDDGSTDRTAEAANGGGATLIRHEGNLGKGAALRSGFAHALRMGFDAVITLDADGQHDPEELPSFIRAFGEGAGDIIIGSRLRDQKGIPMKRYLANRFGVLFLSRATGQHIEDTQSGFRLYSRDVMALPLHFSGFEAESEILIRASRNAYRIGSIPVRTIYPEDHRSHFRPVRDFYRISIAVLKTMKDTMV